MDIYTEVYASIEDEEVWSAVEDEVEAAIRTEVGAVLEGHLNDHHDFSAVLEGHLNDHHDGGSHYIGDDISAAVRSALVTVLENLLTPPCATPSEGDPTT